MEEKEGKPNTSQLHPEAMRLMLRNGKLKSKATTFYSIGYKQANLVILPSEYSEDFAKFAKGNAGAVPILYMSKPGETGAPPLCDNSDVRTDLPSYQKIVRGKIECRVVDLLDYDLSDYVAFYMGCSFSFNNILLSHNILSQEDKNVSMYESNIDCYSSGAFKCKMVVSLRAIPEDKLSLLATVTNPLWDVHGAPIYYGNPAAIGISDLNEGNLGDPTSFIEGEVPVFWCCGVTSANALKSASVIDLAFSHTPGHMFLTDIIQSDGAGEPSVACEVMKYNEKAPAYSTLSKKTLDTLDSIYSIISIDPRQRGIGTLVSLPDFVKSALTLSHASSVAITTGFPVHIDCDPPDETDGITGVISIASVLQSLGKRVTLIVDDYTLPLHKKMYKEFVDRSILQEGIQIVPYIQTSEDRTRLRNKDGELIYDVMMAVERSGKAKDSRYYSMRAIDVTKFVRPIDDLFIEAKGCSGMTTIAIGDGGNELGMGKVFDNVVKHVPFGKKIACVVAADLLIAAGCSNWGCYALGFALYALRSCDVHDRYLRRAVGFPEDKEKPSILSIKKERSILEVVESFGMKDGQEPHQAISADGMFFDKEHTDVLQRMGRLVGLDY